jgi:hypothetical protein
MASPEETEEAKMLVLGGLWGSVIYSHLGRMQEDLPKDIAAYVMISALLTFSAKQSCDRGMSLEGFLEVVEEAWMGALDMVAGEAGGCGPNQG